MNPAEHHAAAEALVTDAITLGTPVDWANVLLTAADIHLRLASTLPVAAYPPPPAPKCPETAVGGYGCTLPPGHDGDHHMEEA